MVRQINEIRKRNTRLCCALLRASQSVSERGPAEGCHRNKTLSNAMQCGLSIRDARQDRNFCLKNAWAHRRSASRRRRRGKTVDRRRSRSGGKAARSAAPRQLGPRVFGTLKKRIAAASGYRILSIDGADTFEIGHHGRERRHRNRRDYLFDTAAKWRPRVSHASIGAFEIGPIRCPFHVRAPRPAQQQIEMRRAR